MVKREDYERYLSGYRQSRNTEIFNMGLEDGRMCKKLMTLSEFEKELAEKEEFEMIPKDFKVE